MYRLTLRQWQYGWKCANCKLKYCQHLLLAIYFFLMIAKLHNLIGWEPTCGSRVWFGFDSEWVRAGILQLLRPSFPLTSISHSPKCAQWSSSNSKQIDAHLWENANLTCPVHTAPAASGDSHQIMLTEGSIWWSISEVYLHFIRLGRTLCKAAVSGSWSSTPSWHVQSIEAIWFENSGFSAGGLPFQIPGW